MARCGNHPWRWVGVLAFCLLAIPLWAAQTNAEPQQVLAVKYLGPGGPLSGPVTLRAGAASRHSRVVAVTFLLDGAPLGSDTTVPYALDLDAGLLRPGRHGLRVEAVDALGSRARTKAITVTTRARTGRML